MSQFYKLESEGVLFNGDYPNEINAQTKKKYFSTISVLSGPSMFYIHFRIFSPKKKPQVLFFELDFLRNE